MKEKITYLMKSEGLSTTRLAEILEIQPSAVSHLASGRNKPGYDLLQKILRRFPRINPDWLLLDSDQPYRTDDDDQQLGDEAADGSSTSLFDDLARTNSPQAFARVAADAQQQSHKNRPQSHHSTQNQSSKSPIFVVVFYDDGSCENFAMRQ